MESFSCKVQELEKYCVILHHGIFSFDHTLRLSKPVDW